jgi:hypothetical protein
MNIRIDVVRAIVVVVVVVVDARSVMASSAV